jgi:hypothetical protein
MASAIDIERRDDDHNPTRTTTAVGAACTEIPDLVWLQDLNLLSQNQLALLQFRLQFRSAIGG